MCSMQMCPDDVSVCIFTNDPDIHLLVWVLLMPSQGPESNAALLPEASEDKKGTQRSGRFFRVRIAEKKSDMVMMLIIMQTGGIDSLHMLFIGCSSGFKRIVDEQDPG